MLKRFLNLPVLIVVFITALAIVWLISYLSPQRLPETAAPTGQANPLSISQDGSQTTTNVPGSALQQATPPSTPTDFTPQQSSSSFGSVQ
jgi:hypothetical protein